jgi:hypothetical protein
MKGVAMRRLATVSAVAVLVVAWGLVALHDPPRKVSAPSLAPPAAQPDAKAAFAALPLRFEPNVGQTDPRVGFLSRGPGYALLLTDDGAVLKLRRPSEDKAAPSTRQAAVALRFEGANPHARPVTGKRLDGVSNYLRPGRSISGVPGYASVAYRGVYDGIDVTYHGSNRGELEFDLTLAPGADPEVVRLRYTGASRLRIDRSGSLVVRTRAGSIRQAPPVVYQTVDGARQRVPGHYVLRGPREVGFSLGAYDRTAPVVIDPVISYATYLGGSGDDFPVWSDIDQRGNFYVAGDTFSPDFPTTPGAYQTDFGGGDDDAFVAKLDPTGSRLVYATYLGGEGPDFAIGMDVDRFGSVVATGGTGSPDFPTTPGAFSRRPAGGLDTFVTKLDPSGSRLLWSSLLGGEADDVGFISFFDRGGNVLVEGDTGSPGFPTTRGSFQPRFGGGDGDGYVTKLTPNGAKLVFSTFIGGSAFDGAHDGELDLWGNFYIDGPTSSEDFPVSRHAFQPAYGGGDSDAWVAKLDASGRSLRYSSYLGGSGFEDVTDLTVDLWGNAYVPGPTSSTDFPVSDRAFQRTFGGGEADGYLAKVDDSGRRLDYATYLGGSEFDVTGGVRVDIFGNAYFPGITGSPEFPVTRDAFQPAFGGGNIDALIGVLDARGSRLLFASFLGGSGDDGSAGAGEWLDRRGNFYVPGFTTSTDFPVTEGALQTTNAGGADVFLVKIDLLRRGAHPKRPGAAPGSRARGDSGRPPVTRSTK